MKLGFIGTGKITDAVVRGFCTSAVAGVEIFVSPRNTGIANALVEAFPNVQKMTTNQAVVDAAEIVFVAVRPPVALAVLSELRFSSAQQVISFVPLLKQADLFAAVQPATRVGRAIPLPSVVYHNCPIPLFNISPQIAELFRYIGQPLLVNSEAELHAIWTLTGLISPYYHLLYELSKWTISHGVAAETAHQYVADLFQSLSHMAQQQQPIDFKKLAAHAATPNGMNEQAAKEITEKGAHQVYAAACDRLLTRF
ncbi:hypothetical protein EXU57_20205 [Segetibacter sp. 3557_3]|uniref:NAD(P)-binding domain-containing protein n=1 Tax=Segetibacter sp. 3557_3 TaxID=2547429 RepID=UPI0010586616|nr:NAD(P)-binding domain-containing protein [Segetibacter sp. 3557_3]TDH21266.1 hypothetical protein EXU57_20205 [Segetibacter sp. 3557_3]